MNERQKKQRIEAMERSMGVCAVCGKSLNNGFQYGHKLGNTETCRKLYGSFFIDSTFNGEMVCSLECNALVDVGKSDGAILRKLAEILIKETSKKIGKAGLDYITDVLLSTYKAMGYNNESKE